MGKVKFRKGQAPLFNQQSTASKKKKKEKKNKNKKTKTTTTNYKSTLKFFHVL